MDGAVASMDAEAATEVPAPDQNTADSSGEQILAKDHDMPDQQADTQESDDVNDSAAAGTVYEHKAISNQENQPGNHADTGTASVPPAPSSAPDKPRKSRRKTEVMDIATAKAVLAEPFDENAEADRPIPALFKQHPDGSAAPLDGILSMFLTSTTLDIVKCPQLAGQDVPHGTSAVISKDVLMGDIQFRGAISDFYAFKAAIAESDLDGLLLRVNATDVYKDGNNFELVVSQAAGDVSKKVAEEIERRRLRDARIARRQLAVRSLPLSARDIKIKPWPSLGSEAEVDLLQLRPLRETIVMTLERPRAAFARPNINFVDKDAQEIHAMSASHMELRPYKDPAFELQRRLADRGVQAVPQQEHCGVQATPLPLRNNSSQYDARTMPAEEARQLQRTGGYRDFLVHVRGDVERCLLQNTIIDICADDFARMQEEEALKGTRSDKPINEVISCMDIRHCRDMRVSQLRWHPQLQRLNAGVVALSLTSRATFAERVAAFGRPLPHAVLVWHFRDLIHPYMVLESPHEVTAFDFNPQHMEVVVGGCANGQVIMWELTEDILARAAQGSSDEHTDLVVDHKCLSTLEFSHKCAVAQLQWLPGWEITNRGALLTDEEARGACNFFATCAADGRVFFWDWRMDLQRSKRRKNDDPMEREWKPTHAVPLLSLQGSDLACTVMVFDALVIGDLFVGSFDGELASASFVRPEDVDNPDYMHSVTRPHCGPVSALARSPYFPDILLSAGDWTFHLWRVGTAAPIFTARSAPDKYTAAAWSPTREGVLFLGLEDGTLQCWDLLDRSHEASLSAPVSPSAVRALSFNTGAATAKSQLLAIGDDEGVLRVADVPSTLRRPMPGEHARMARFLEAQTHKVADTESRQALRDARTKQLEAERTAAEEADAKAREAAEGGRPVPVAGSKEDEAAAAAEQEYLALEARLKADLGLVAAEEDGG
eukprot:jgi/Ulvmu1/12770/UM096_0012.1